MTTVQIRCRPRDRVRWLRAGRALVRSGHIQVDRRGALSAFVRYAVARYLVRLR